MMIVSYRIELKPTVIFSETDVFCFLLYAERHYDALCRSMGQQGGFLWGMKNRLESATEEQRMHAKAGQKVCEVEMTISELDLLAKICECDPELCKRVQVLFDEAQKRYRLANGIPPAKKSRKRCRS